MLDINVHNNSIQIGPHFSVDCQRTLRIPDDEGTYPLPPGLGSFPIYRVEDYAKRIRKPGTRMVGSLFRCINGRQCGFRLAGQTGVRVR